MAQQRGRGRSAPQRQTRREPAEKDLSVYLEKDPTDLHRAYASWLVRMVGFKPSQCENLKEAFLMGVSLAVVCRPDFQKSDFLEEWREKHGVAKRGPKPKEEPEPEPEADDDDDDFDADDSNDDESDDDDDDFDEPEPAPKASRSQSGASRSRNASASTAGKTTTQRNTSSRGRAATRSKSDDDDDFLFG